MGKMVKCRVTGPKGLWHEGANLPEGTEIELSESSCANKVARGNIYAKGEYEGIEASAKALAKASQDEKDARAPAVPKKAPVARPASGGRSSSNK